MIDLGSSLRVRHGDSPGLVPFSRDKLFISVYESCKHRPEAVADADALTRTIISLLPQTPHSSAAILERNDIVSTASAVLRRFDKAAATMFEAYHPHTRR